MTKLEGNLTPNVRFNAKGDNSLLVVRWGSDVVRRRLILALQGAQRNFGGSQRPKMAFWAVFVALKTAHRAGR